MLTDMNRLWYLLGLGLLLSCQTESLDIRANYRIRLNATAPGTTLKLRQAYPLPLELVTDSYYANYGYQLQFYQVTGLGRLAQTHAGNIAEPVLQRVPVALPLGPSVWQYTPEATGTSQLMLIAQQERGYTQPDTVRLTFHVNP